MATIYYSGNQRTRAIEYAVTISSISVGQTVIATIAGKAETYTSTTATPSVAASAVVAQLSSSLLLELDNFTFTADGAIIRAVGPSDGAPITISWTGTATLSGTTPSVTALSPENISDAANYIGGSLPTNGDILEIDGPYNLRFGLAQFTSNTITLVRRASHTGVIGLPDTNALGYPEFLPKHFETAGTVLQIEDGGSGSVRVRSTASSAVTATIVGSGGGQLGSERVDLYGTPASSIININGGSLSFCTGVGNTGTAATIRCANGALRIGTGATLATITVQNSQVAIGSNVTTYTQDRGSSTTFARAASGTTLNIEDGVFSHASTGGWTTVNVRSGGTFDVTFAPATVAITTINLDESGTLLDPNERIVKPYTVNVNGEMANVTIDLGTTIALTVG